jgi:hypothetical protein
LQDWPATRAIASAFPNEQLLFVPGHTGDFISGGHIPFEIFQSKCDCDFTALVPDAIFSHHYHLWPISSDCRDIRNAMIQRIASQISRPLNTPLDASRAYEEWEWQSRQARFIVNAVRVYEYFNHSWAIPLWDHRIMEFFSRLPLSAKIRKRIYINALLRHVFTGPVARLRDLPVSSTTPLEYRSENATRSQQSLKDILLWFACRIASVGRLSALARNQRADLFKMYGFFMSGNVFSLLKPLHTQIRPDGYCSNENVGRIISARANSPLISQTLQSLFSAYYISACI